VASSADGGVTEKSKVRHELQWWEKARLSLAQAAGWLVLSMILLLVMGIVLPRLNSLVEEVAPNIFVLCAAVLASVVASWRSGKAATELIGPILALVGVAAVVAEANS
jgi:hypothetical protein